MEEFRASRRAVPAAGEIVEGTGIEVVA